jgi:23S rRNA (cytosine1962-C5)-methyltransferase
MRAASRLRSGHPWVFRSDLPNAGKHKLPETPRAAIVHVKDERGRMHGTALSSSSSQIALRMVSDKLLTDDSAMLSLLRERIQAACAYRKELVHDSNACRLVFSEADGVPGLIADRYNDVITVQFLTQAMDRDDVRSTVLDTFQKEFSGKKKSDVHIVERVDAHIRELEQLPDAESRVLFGKNSKTQFQMNGLDFQFDALAGQKTGAFLDQRENYAATDRWAKGRALDVFCYQGGFALHMARKCEHVTAVDQSRAALESGEQNEALNRKKLVCKEIEWTEGNAFDWLKEQSSSSEGHATQKFDTIVLDPPAFAKSKRNLETAIPGYKEINLRALKMLRSGGVLVTCSCSQAVSESGFTEMLASAAADAKRTVRIVEKRGAALDHPNIATIPETNYLKCLIVTVA